VMAVAGGAFCPPIMGAIADNSTMSIAFLIPMVCFAFIGYYAIWGQRMGRSHIKEEEELVMASSH